MLNNIFFLGGIHGSGKTTIGKILAKKLGIEYENTYAFGDGTSELLELAMV